MSWLRITGKGPLRLRTQQPKAKGLYWLVNLRDRNENRYFERPIYTPPLITEGADD